MKKQELVQSKHEIEQQIIYQKLQDEKLKGDIKYKKQKEEENRIQQLPAQEQFKIQQKQNNNNRTLLKGEHLVLLNYNKEIEQKVNLNKELKKKAQIYEEKAKKITSGQNLPQQNNLNFHSNQLFGNIQKTNPLFQDKKQDLFQNNNSLFGQKNNNSLFGQKNNNQLYGQQKKIDLTKNKPIGQQIMEKNKNSKINLGYQIGSVDVAKKFQEQQIKYQKDQIKKQQEKNKEYAKDISEKFNSTYLAKPKQIIIPKKNENNSNASKQMQIEQNQENNNDQSKNQSQQTEKNDFKQNNIIQNNNNSNSCTVNNINPEIIDKIKINDEEKNKQQNQIKQNFSNSDEQIKDDIKKLEINEKKQNVVILEDHNYLEDKVRNQNKKKQKNNNQNQNESGDEDEEYKPKQKRGRKPKEKQQGEETKKVTKKVAKKNKKTKNIEKQSEDEDGGENENDENEGKKKKPAQKKKVKKLYGVKLKKSKDQNLVRVNLKNKFKDKFRGNIRQNQVQFTKNGQIKQKKIPLKKLQQLKEERDANNPSSQNIQNPMENLITQETSMYTKCLSSALFINILDDDMKKIDEKNEDEEQDQEQNLQKNNDQIIDLNEDSDSKSNKKMQVENENKENEKQNDQDKYINNITNQFQNFNSDKNTIQNQKIYGALKKLFGFEEFRYGQLESIQSILQGKNTMSVMSTGHGKSLIYQLPSYLMPGVTLVISPLLSLMLDQISKLPDELPGACINSQLTYKEKMHIIDLVKQGKVKILYISPEALQSTIVYNYKQFPKINFVCIDEAHCVSEWSHNFRTTYLIIDNILQKKMGAPPILALTATATQQTQTSISKKLKIENIFKSNSINRSNLILSVSYEGDHEKQQALLELLSSERYKKLKSIIIYCMYVRTCESITNYLIQNGYNAAAYHSGQEDKKKQHIQDQFMSGKLRIVVATVAFGMGIDKSDIRSVIHYNSPKTVENYVQEIGRAGRDGQDAYCHLFLSDNDYLRQKGFVYSDTVNYNLLEGIVKRINRCVLESEYVKHLAQEHEDYEECSNSKKRRRNKLENGEYDASEAEKQGNFLEDLLMEDMENELFEKIKESVKNKIFYLDTKQCSSQLDSKKDNFLTILLKMQEFTQEKLQIFPSTYENCTLKFYKFKPEQVAQDSEIMQKILQLCSQKTDCYTFNLIKACNLLEMEPIDLIQKLRGFAQSHHVYCDYKNDIVAYKINELLNEDEFQKLITDVYKEMEQYDQVTHNKVDFLYVTTKFSSYASVLNIMEKSKEQLKQKCVSQYFDKYFQLEGTDYNSILQDKIPGTMAQLMPYQILDSEEFENIKEKSYNFISEEYRNFNRYKDEDNIPKGYMNLLQNPVVITRIMLGVSSESFPYTKWNQHYLWNKYFSFKFEDIIKGVNEGIKQFQQNLEQKGRTLN